MHLHVTLNRIVMLHNFVTPNILSHVPKIIRNTPKYTATAFQTAKIEYFSNGFISNGPFNNCFVQSYLIFCSLVTLHLQYRAKRSPRNLSGVIVKSGMSESQNGAITVVPERLTHFQFVQKSMYIVPIIYLIVWDLTLDVAHQN